MWRRAWWWLARRVWRRTGCRKMCIRESECGIWSVSIWASRDRYRWWTWYGYSIDWGFVVACAIPRIIFTPVHWRIRREMRRGIYAKMWPGRWRPRSCFHGNNVGKSRTSNLNCRCTTHAIVDSQKTLILFYRWFWLLQTHITQNSTQTIFPHSFYFDTILGQ